ncbi:hypothetical protein RBSWK_04997 [Rhodopirellula baltica SWK14]|uniref:Uncharacterized protein n=1 Tax=Rhodopirellula baltica SWK14 TaxID=993516 RepID=L7CAG9_RHOBT|nr:hypothetical protein RBSWK_04997 [Rhodopirellula baltica SWK14]
MLPNRRRLHRAALRPAMPGMQKGNAEMTVGNLMDRMGVRTECQ